MQRELDGRVRAAATILSIVMFISFFLPYAAYSETDTDWHGEETTTTIPVSGYELADGAIHRTVLGFSVRLSMGASYPFFWGVPLAAALSLLVALFRRIPSRPLMLSIVGFGAAGAALAGFAQLMLMPPPRLLSNGYFAPDYGLALTFVAALLIGLIGLKGWIKRGIKWM
jgi:hypothetical protein